MDVTSCVPSFRFRTLAIHRAGYAVFTGTRRVITMNFVNKEEFFLIRAFVAHENDADAVQPTMKLIKQNKILKIDWKNLHSQPRWRLCALHYIDGS